MRLRHIPGAEEAIASSPYVIQDPELKKGAWNQVFGNSHPIEIEVGMGKGRFLMELALSHPDVNYIGIARAPLQMVTYSICGRRERVQPAVPLPQVRSWLIPSIFQAGQ